ncbi:hypothetical protein [Halovulum sp. GXIMD14793]
MQTIDLLMRGGAGSVALMVAGLIMAGAETRRAGWPALAVAICAASYLAISAPGASALPDALRWPVLIGAILLPPAFTWLVTVIFLDNRYDRRL